MDESLYFRWIKDRNAIVEECGGWNHYAKKVDWLFVSSRLSTVSSDSLEARIAQLNRRYVSLIEQFEVIVGEHRVYRHTTRLGPLVEVELSSGDSFLGYDLLDALEQAADSRREKSDADAAINHADRTPQREAGRCEANS